MSGCAYCSLPLAEGEPWNHHACEAESIRRDIDGRCIMCGEGVAARPSSVCYECRTSNAPYAGYPPGGD